MTEYEIWQSNIGLTEAMVEESRHEEIFNRLNSVPVVIELDVDGKFTEAWTTLGNFGRPVQIHINQEGSEFRFIPSANNLKLFLA